MGNKFYVGTVVHVKFFGKKISEERMVLYSEDGHFFIDLTTFKKYPIFAIAFPSEDYVKKDSLILTDPLEYNTDYLYLLDKYKNNKEEKENKEITKILKKVIFRK